MVLEFDNILFQIESSRICRIDRPRWWIIGTEGGFVKYGIDPQEDALRAGDIDRAAEPPELEATVRRSDGDRADRRNPLPDRPRSLGRLLPKYRRTPRRPRPLAVTAEQAREVVRLLEAATCSTREHATVTGPWGLS